VLRNPRHERFAQELASGKTADAAYVLAGYRENRSNAARLNANRHIQKRVAEIQSVGAERAAVTVESLIAEAESARKKGDGR
jgi:phage terminase small subunit